MAGTFRIIFGHWTFGKKPQPIHYEIIGAQMCPLIIFSVAPMLQKLYVQGRVTVQAYSLVAWRRVRLCACGLRRYQTVLPRLTTLPRSGCQLYNHYIYTKFEKRLLFSKLLPTSLSLSVGYSFIVGRATTLANWVTASKLLCTCIHL